MERDGSSTWTRGRSTPEPGWTTSPSVGSWRTLIETPPLTLLPTPSPRYSSSFNYSVRVSLLLVVQTYPGLSTIVVFVCLFTLQCTLEDPDAVLTAAREHHLR